MPLTVTWPVEWCAVMFECVAVVAAAGTAARTRVSRNGPICAAPYRTGRLAQATWTALSRGHADRGRICRPQPFNLPGCRRPPRHGPARPAPLEVESPQPPLDVEHLAAQVE